jgi:hypothetical protein
MSKRKKLLKGACSECGANFLTEDSVYRIYNVTGHLSFDGEFHEDSSLDGDGTVFCSNCDKPVKGTSNSVYRIYKDKPVKGTERSQL